jgi:hypothetical protein
MVHLLIIDIPSDKRKPAFADGRCKIFVGPLKIATYQFHFVSPKGTFTFQKLHLFGYAVLTFQEHQHVDMIVMTIDPVNVYFFALCIFADVLTKLGQEWRL